jgi:hypothetical protein
MRVQDLEAVDAAAEWEPVNLDLGCPNVVRLKFRERTVMDD